MKTILRLVIILVLFPLASFSQQEIKIMSYNIRLDVKSDGENQWDKRKDKVAALMNYYEADFIGGQEVQHHQPGRGQPQARVERKARCYIRELPGWAGERWLDHGFALPGQPGQ